MKEADFLRHPRGKCSRSEPSLDQVLQLCNRLWLRVSRKQRNIRVEI